MGFQMNGGRDVRVRSVVNWDAPYATALAPHYQKLMQIRTQFPAFRRQAEDSNGDYQINGNDTSVQPRLSTTANENDIYAYGRPYPDQNGVVVCNFTDRTIDCEVTLALESWAAFSNGFQPGSEYWLNDLYHNTNYAVQGDSLHSISLALEPYAVQVYVISTMPMHVELPQLAVSVPSAPLPAQSTQFALLGNFPNPFNPTTVIRYAIHQPSYVHIAIYNMMGQHIRTLHRGRQHAGTWQIQWNGRDEQGQKVSSGVYLCRLQAANRVATRKMVLLP